MKVTVTCDRCGKTVEGLRTENATGGFYDTSAGYWAMLANPGESVVCDPCMWADPRYIEHYGRRAPLN